MQYTDGQYYYVNNVTKINNIKNLPKSKQDQKVWKQLIREKKRTVAISIE